MKAIISYYIGYNSLGWAISQKADGSDAKIVRSGTKVLEGGLINRLQSVKAHTSWIVENSPKILPEGAELEVIVVINDFTAKDPGTGSVYANTDPSVVEYTYQLLITGAVLSSFESLPLQMITKSDLKKFCKIRSKLPQAIISDYLLFATPYVIKNDFLTPGAAEALVASLFYLI